MEEEKEQTTKLGTLTQELRDHAIANNEELVDLNSKDVIANAELGKIRSGIGTVIGKLIFGFRDLAETIIGNDLLRLEQQKELTGYLQKIGENTKESDDKKEDAKKKDGGDDFKVSGIAGLFGAAAASLLIIPGFAVGFVEGLGKILGVGKGKGGGFLGRLGKSIKGLFTTVKMGIQLFFQSIGGAFKSFFKTNKVGILLSKAFKPMFDGVKLLITQVKGIGKMFGGIGKGGKILGMFTKIFSPIKQFFTTFGKLAPKFFAFGRTLGKLFLPLTIVFGIFDGLKGAIDGASKEEGFFNKLIGGLGGAIKGVLGNLIGLPLDLLKNGVAWILGKFGMNDAADALKGFSFKDLIGKIVDAPMNYLKGIVENIKGIFTSGEGSLLGNLYRAGAEIMTSILTFPISMLQKAVIGLGELFGFDMSAFESVDLGAKIKELLMMPFNAIAKVFDFITNMFSKEGRAENVSVLKDVGAKINNFLKKIVAFLLPKPDPNGAWYSPSNLASKAIPKAIYDYAGIDKETGAEIPAEGAMFTDRFGNLTDNVIDFDVSNLSEEAQKKIGKIQDNLADNLERQGGVDEEIFMLENKEELTKKEAKKLSKLKKEQKKLQEAEEQAERDIRLAVSREAELTERPEVVKDEFGGVDTGIRVDGIAQDVEPGTSQTIFQNADVAQAAADADLRKLEEQSFEFAELRAKFDKALAASSREKFDMNTEEGIEAKRQADLKVQYLSEQLANKDDEMTATADKIALTAKGDVNYNERMQDIKLMSDDTQLINEAIAKVDNEDKKLSNTEIRANSLEGNVTDTIQPVANTQGAQMEATIADTADRQQVVAVQQGSNTNAPVTNNNNSSTTNISYNESRHIDPNSDHYVFA